MTTNTIAQHSYPQGFSPDPLTDILRSGAQRLIEQAVEADLLFCWRRLHLIKRATARLGWFATGQPTGTRGDHRNRRGAGQDVRLAGPRQRNRESPFHLNDPAALSAQSQIHRGAAALLGPNAAGLPQSTISRRKADRWDHNDRWQRRNLST